MKPITIPAHIAEILSHKDAQAGRDEYAQIWEIHGGGAVVKTSEILALLSTSMSPEHESRHSKRHSSYRRNSLYGIDVHSHLAVVLERDGSWDSKYNFGKERKYYVLIDLQTGKRRFVGSSRVRGEIRTDWNSSSAGVAGAVAFSLGITKSAARKLMKNSDRVAVFEDARPAILSKEHHELEQIAA